MKERIVELIKLKNLSAAKLADILQVQPSAISHILSGRNNPSYDLIIKILTSFPDINPSWLMLGHNPVLLPSIEPGIISNSTDSYEQELVYELQPELQGSKTNHGGNNLKSKIPDQNNYMNTVKQNYNEGNNQASLNINKSVKYVMVFYDDQSFEIYDHQRK